jgi:hypothetical protein
VRISGTFSETSAFSFYAAAVHLLSESLARVIAPKSRASLALATGILLLLSTSGTAYVGPGAYAGVLVFSRPGVISRSAIARKQRLWVVGACAGLLVVLYVILFLPSVANAITDFFNTAVFSKAGSSSGVERMGWNAQGVTNLLDTLWHRRRARQHSHVELPDRRAGESGVVGVVCYGMLWYVAAHADPQRVRLQRARHLLRGSSRYICDAHRGLRFAGVFELARASISSAAAGALSPRVSRRAMARARWVSQGDHEKLDTSLSKLICSPSTCRTRFATSIRSS